MAASSHNSRQSPIANFFRRHHNNNLDLPNNTPDIEFQESDLYFTNDDSLSSSSIYSSKNQSKLKSRMRSGKVVDESSRSLPVRIPAESTSWSTTRIVLQLAEREGSDEEDEGNIRDDREAPHEYLARKRGASLSVHEGVGRTLKGRDMSSVRNAVWKRIGFED